MLSKNLLKANQFVLKETEPIVLDTNDLVAKRIESFYPAFGSVATDGFKSGLNAPEIDPSLYEEEYTDEEEYVEEEPVYQGPTPEEMIAEAQAEIDEMRAEAEKNISFLKKRSMEEGRKEGYEAGKAQAMQEVEILKQEWKQKKEALEEEFQKKIDEIEPQFIHTLTGIYEKIFQVDLAQYKPILLHAISSTIRQIEGCKDFLVHVSRVDYEEVLAQRENIISQLPSKTATVELIEDSTLKENECMIETSSGIYDCSLGLQLSELTRRLKLLSYDNN